MTLVGLLWAPYLLRKHATFKRRFFPKERVELLDNPIQVNGWDTDGLLLQGGDKLPVPGITGLPASSKALTEAIKAGVEIGPDGRISALVRIHHWCGSDPVRKHIAKVDLSHFLAFTLADYFCASDPALAGLWPFPALEEHNFSEWGWDFIQFDQYQDFLTPISESRGTFGSAKAER